MEMKELKGPHLLDGVDVLNEERTIYGTKEQCEVVLFKLDGIVYEVNENPDDGYRSSHEDLRVSDRLVKNTFNSVPVLAMHKTQGSYSSEDDILVFVSAKTGEEIFSVGTSNVADYYPCWECNFSAEKLDEASKAGM